MLKKGVFYIGAVLMVGCTTLPDHSAPKRKHLLFLKRRSPSPHLV